MVTRLTSLALAAAIAFAACGGGGDGDAGPADGGDSELLEQLTVTHDDERVPYGFQEGRYRIRWTAPDCERGDVHLLITPAAGGEPVYDNPRPSIPILLVNQLEQGEYFVEQANAACTEWEIEMVKISGPPRT